MVGVPAARFRPRTEAPAAGQASEVRAGRHGAACMGGTTLKGMLAGYMGDRSLAGS